MCPSLRTSPAPTYRLCSPPSTCNPPTAPPLLAAFTRKQFPTCAPTDTQWPAYLSDLPLPLYMTHLYPDHPATFQPHSAAGSPVSTVPLFHQHSPTHSPVSRLSLRCRPLAFPCALACILCSLPSRMYSDCSISLAMTQACTLPALPPRHCALPVG